VTNKEDLLAQLRIDPNQKTEDLSNTPKWIAVGVVLVLLIIAIWFFSREPASVKVEVEMARMITAGSSVAVLDATGYVVARRTATVSSKVTARVVEILVEEGQQVEKDQVVARLDDSNTLKTVELSKAELHAAQTFIAETQARLNESKINLQRFEELAKRQMISAASLDKARADYESLRAQLDSRKAEVAVGQKRLAVAQQNLEDLTLRAPFAGVVISKDSQPGEMISPISAGGGFTRTGICTLVDMSSLEIEVDVNEAYIQRIKLEQEVAATLEAYPDWKIPAKVIAIIPTADRQKATVKVRIGFAQTDPRILPDMGVKVTFLGSESAGDLESQEVSGVRVPISAVRSEGEDKYMFVVENGVAKLRKVTLKASKGSHVYIETGLEPGEDFVVKITPDLQDGVLIER
jgi:RND family efflux transporter MFP subunit